MTTNERDLLRRMSTTILELIDLAESIHRYGPAFPGKPQDDLAVKKARAVLDETRDYLDRNSRR